MGPGEIVAPPPRLSSDYIVTKNRHRINHRLPGEGEELREKNRRWTQMDADDTHCQTGAAEAKCRPDADGGVSQRVIHRLHRLRRLPEEGEELREKNRRWTQMDAD